MNTVKICNFCFREDPPDIRSVDSYSKEFDAHRIQDIVTKHLWFTPEQLVGFEICSVCWNKLSEFHLFYCQVEQLCKQESSTYKLFLVEKLETSAEIPDDDNEFKNAIIKTEVVNNEMGNEHVGDIELEEKLNLPSGLEKEQSEEPKTGNQNVGHNVMVNDQDILLFCQLDCKYCSESFVTFKQLKKHYSSVHNQRGFVMCCDLRFDDPTRLREHIRVHMNPSTFHCSECKRNFCSKRSLLNHRLLLHLPNEQRSFSCNLCSKRFAKQYQLNTHMLGHKNQKDFPCQNCDKQFSTRGALANHFKNIHERANEVMCEICSKVLKTRGAFQIHRAEHFNTKRIQCSTCGKWLKNEHSMRKHMIRHQEETRVFVCDMCGKRSPNSHALKKHIQDQHTMERIHRCTLCEKSFKRALALKEHMATHTGQQLYSCAHCAKEFKSSANLYSHRKKAHPVEWQEYQKTKKVFMSDG
ncbi:transcription factor grauzone-like [Toxorhynchites rutilus septentrionalis]|uniref:transcription factor grauzone-like n=1 Tax=Toxorhynchites rutilus septentrionalis TaxID=329112 RepID=UPI00247A8B66|nr:transcription factor grauzone-like [Toxorhynchites rutilus septentrionalis]XP_055622142.1 transcription factor grauzone-like [Toxorhynchites rutilus septentrionalis]XP_055622143.1 transcription factor grauzone-like [Toxorhynchites rutilus septentrionalis]